MDTSSGTGDHQEQGRGQIPLLIVTGLSGAGKSSALRILEDLDFHCVENLPIFLLDHLLTGLCQVKQPQRVAVVMDCRDPGFPHSHQEVFARKRATGYPLEILFLEATDEVLLQRYSELRRPHPLAGSDTLRDGIEREKLALRELRAAADQRLDTSGLSIHRLRERLSRLYATQDPRTGFRVNFLSFGFSKGLPVEADMVLDVRFLPNPHYLPELRDKTGLDPAVAAYVLENQPARDFLAALQPLLFLLLPEYRREGKAAFTLAVGCTGGRHRSVAIAEELQRLLSGREKNTRTSHRDI